MSAGVRPSWRSARKDFALRLFDNFLPGLVEHQLMMVIIRRRKPEQVLQQPVQARRHEKILAANDVGDAAQGIVDDNGDMITDQNIPARKDSVAP